MCFQTVRLPSDRRLEGPPVTESVTFGLLRHTRQFHLITMIWVEFDSSAGLFDLQNWDMWRFSGLLNVYLKVCGACFNKDCAWILFSSVLSEVSVKPGTSTSEPWILTHSVLLENYLICGVLSEEFLWHGWLIVQYVLSYMYVLTILGTDLTFGIIWSKSWVQEFPNFWGVLLKASGYWYYLTWILPLVWYTIQSGL